MLSSKLIVGGCSETDLRLMFAKDILRRLWCILGSLHLTKDELLDLHPLLTEDRLRARLKHHAHSFSELFWLEQAIGGIVRDVVHIAFKVVTHLLELVILSALERGFDVDEAFLEIVSALHQHDPQCAWR